MISRSYQETFPDKMSVLGQEETFPPEMFSWETFPDKMRDGA